MNIAQRVARAEPGAPAQALHRPAPHGGAGPAHGQGEPGRLRGARHRAGAGAVCAEDDAVDALKEQIFRELSDLHDGGSAQTIPRAIRLILISRFLERVADHATNIAEMVVYMVDAQDGASHPRPRAAGGHVYLSVSADRRYQLTVRGGQSGRSTRSSSDCASRRLVAALRGHAHHRASSSSRTGRRSSNLKITSAALKELRYGYKVFAPWRGVPKVTVFGSARTPPTIPCPSRRTPSASG